ncbi:hypothetical protein Hokovirus_1_348 [Hokovirus HKV1]|uniref:Uncharacterized protein n=1 Tax=Hokovirus HKV1 TaxID=1977638 RepID=A0A1V0SFG8_9VIRU|nr:hypothetical protein Hokovirus_1_348 [Hokovirus HKV1]
MKPKIACVINKYEPIYDTKYLLFYHFLKLKPFICDISEFKKSRFLNENLFIYGFNDYNFNYSIFPFAKNIICSDNSDRFYESIINKKILPFSKNIFIYDYCTFKILDESFYIHEHIKYDYTHIVNTTNELSYMKGDFENIINNFEAEEVKIGKQSETLGKYDY